jgi:hypothetical protein
MMALCKHRAAELRQGMDVSRSQMIEVVRKRKTCLRCRVVAGDEGKKYEK